MKNAVTMLVLRSRKDSHMTLRITGDNNRNLGLEREFFLQHTRHRPKFLKGVTQLIQTIHAQLPLTVVSKLRCFQNGWKVRTLDDLEVAK